MKNIIIKSFGAILFTASLIPATNALAQTVEETTTTTTTSAGTVSEFGPTEFVIKTETSSDPLHYTYTKTTTYVDENGDPVSVKTVKSGLPVTVYYTKVGDHLVASKVIVRKAVTEEGATTETTETTQTTTNSAGTITEFGPGGIVIKTTTQQSPLRYASSKTTTYVDEDGNAVSVKTVKSGLPVTVYYTKIGGKLVATKVIVRKAVVTPAPEVIEEKTTTTTIEEK